MNGLPRTAISTMPTVVAIAVVAGVMFALGVLAKSGMEANTGDWLSFAGALLGSGLTVAGSIAVLEWQRGSERRALTALLGQLLDDVHNACVPFQVANPTALQERFGKTVREQVSEVQSAIARIHVFRERWAPHTVAMMKASDTLAGLTFQPSEQELMGLTIYPDDADLGNLNLMGHQVQLTIEEAKNLLSQ